jgi:hypothetical protein
MTKKEEFELANKAYSLMKPYEQGIALVLFRNHKTDNLIEDWVNAIHKICKTIIIDK